MKKLLLLLIVFIVFTGCDSIGSNNTIISKSNIDQISVSGLYIVDKYGNYNEEELMVITNKESINNIISELNNSTWNTVSSIDDKTNDDKGERLVAINMILKNDKYYYNLHIRMDSKKIVLEAIEKAGADKIVKGYENTDERLYNFLLKIIGINQ